MITSVDDYLFVDGADIDADHPHGDLDRIIIDGDVMPLRTGTTSTGVDRKNLLRGEDLAFLMEAVNERRRFLDSRYTLRGTFNHEFIPGQNNFIRDSYRAMIGDFIAEPVEGDLPDDGSDPFVHKSLADLRSKDHVFERLKMQPMMDLFTDLKEMTACDREASGARDGSPVQVITNLNESYPYAGPRGITIGYAAGGGYTEEIIGEKVNHIGGGTFQSYVGMKYSYALADQPDPRFVGSCELWIDARLTYRFYDSHWRASSTQYIRRLVKCTAATQSQPFEFTVPGVWLYNLATSMSPWTPGPITDEEGRSIDLSPTGYLVYRLGDHTKWW